MVFGLESLLMAQPSLQAISPCFIVSNVVRTIAFYRDMLGFELRLLEPQQDPFFAIIGRDGAQIFIKAERGITPTPNHTRHPQQTPMLLPQTLQLVAQPSAFRSWIRTMVCVALRFAILKDICCSLAGR